MGENTPRDRIKRGVRQDSARARARAIADGPRNEEGLGSEANSNLFSTAKITVRKSQY